MSSLTVDYIINGVLGGYDRHCIKFMHTIPFKVGELNNNICSPRVLSRCIKNAISNLGLMIYTQKDLDQLAVLTCEGDIYIRPRNSFRMPIYYEMVLLHEIGHELYNQTLMRSGVSRWARNNVNSLYVRRPALALEEIIVEASSVIVTSILYPELNKKYYGPSFCFIRDRLSDISSYGLSWKLYDEALDYCLTKSLKLSSTLLLAGGIYKCEEGFAA